MKQSLKHSIVALAIAVGALLGGGALVTTSAVYAADNVDPGAQVQEGINQAGGNPAGKKGFGDVVKLIINLLLFIIGALSVIMIIIGGIRYVLSNGDSSAITGAKNTILYAVIGLIVALLAYAIVNFVVTQFT